MISGKWRVYTLYIGFEINPMKAIDTAARQNNASMTTVEAWRISRLLGLKE